MSCLRESIRQLDPELQDKFEVVETAISLSAMLAAGWVLACLLTVKIVESVVEERAQAKTEWGKCPLCGSRLESKGFEPRQIKSMFGMIHWKRRVGRCPKGCHIGQIVPLDEGLGITPNQRTDMNVKRSACLMAVFVPFETAAALLHAVTGLCLSAGATWGWVQTAGAQMVVWLEEELEALAAGQAPEEEPLPAELAAQALLIGADGVMVPFRPNPGTPKGKTVWREVKVGVLARLTSYQTRAGKVVSRLRQRRLVAVLGNMEAFGARLHLEALRQGITHSPCTVWLSDGAQSLWCLFETHFAPYAFGVLDFYHAAQNLWRGIKVWLDGRTTTAKCWFVSARHRLRHGEADALLDDLAAAIALPDLPDTARSHLTKLYAYLDKHRDHIQYEHLKAMGLPIGSGLVESACKWLIQQRFKGVGMRWSEEGFTYLLHLRLAWVNDRFEMLFPLNTASPKS
jgi:hypothetical protein